MPTKLQQSSKKTTSDIVAPNPAGFLNCFLVVHALVAVCLHPALEAMKKSPLGQQNPPPANAGTKLLLHQSSGSPLIVMSVVPGTQELDPSDRDSPVVHLSKFGGVRETTEAVLVSDGGTDFATLVACPLNMGKYKQLPLINGVEVEAYRDTGASVTMVIEKLVHPDQHLLGQQYQVTDAINNTLSHTMAVVNLNWGGVTGPNKVVVATDLPVQCLLGNVLETSAWAEVELEAHAAMLGIPGHIFALTMAQAQKQRVQGRLDHGTIDQVLPKARGRKGKSLATITPSPEDSPFEEEESSPCAEPTPEELAADTAELFGAGGPAWEELSVSQQTRPTLEGLS
ncbi:hypothetical protein NDU88_001660 [Pleurodeles waltl]|uniref:Peptidase A2 domain-containing protein n=1 Tax=Pleurodeles waltl TaxID=8319 RepID=A0AAV7LGL7_PLEWA|nr:hypothetical protein NDU88_001660 [Pleurodeles waltl]